MHGCIIFVQKVKSSLGLQVTLSLSCPLVPLSFQFLSVPVRCVWSSHSCPSVVVMVVCVLGAGFQEDRDRRTDVKKLKSQTTHV